MQDTVDARPFHDDAAGAYNTSSEAGVLSRIASRLNGADFFYHEVVINKCLPGIAR